MKPLAAVLCIAASLTATAIASAQDETKMEKPAENAALLSDPSRITVTGGENVYRAICQGCHMPEGEGAIGAGAYPALANNPNLEFAEYPIFIILNGQKAMPPLGTILDDQQVADVVAYLQTHFGNNFEGEVTPEQVAESRQ